MKKKSLMLLLLISVLVITSISFGDYELPDPKVKQVYIRTYDK